MGFPSGASGKEPTYQHRRHKGWGLDPWVEKIPKGGQGNPLQHSWLENPMYRETWKATAHRVGKSQTQLKQQSKHTHIVDLQCFVSLLCTAKWLSFTYIVFHILFHYGLL